MSESPSKVGTKPHDVESVGEGVLSHSSLKENEDWIKVEAKKLDEEAKGSALDLDKLTAPEAISGKNATKLEEKSEKEGSEDLIGAELVEDEDIPKVSSEDQDAVEDKTSRKDESQKEEDVSNKSSEEEGALDRTSEEIESHESASKGDILEEGALSQATLESKAKTEDNSYKEPKKPTFESTNSEYALDQAITMTNFVKPREIGYSLVEIRKGRVGDMSLDEIDVNGGPTASPTVHRLSVESDESVETQDNEHKLPYWDHVPGIGPAIPEAQILAVVEYMQHWGAKQQGMVGPRNITHLLCPPLDMPPPVQEEESIY